MRRSWNWNQSHAVLALLGKSKNICFQMTQQCQVRMNIQADVLMEINPPLHFSCDLLCGVCGQLPLSRPELISSPIRLLCDLSLQTCERKAFLKEQPGRNTSNTTFLNPVWTMRNYTPPDLVNGSPGSSCGANFNPDHLFLHNVSNIRHRFKNKLE